MAQILSIPLKNYLICCPNGVTTSFSKYLFLGNNPAPISRVEIAIDYQTGQQDSSTIEGVFNIPTIGMAQVIISYIESVVVTTETIFVDTTSSASFWADINGWLQMNNFYDVTYDIGLDKWLINDLTNLSYVKIIKV